MRNAGNHLVRRSVSTFARLRRREHGQSLAEYAMILSLIVVGCIVLLTELGQIIVPFYNGLDGVF